MRVANACNSAQRRPSSSRRSDKRRCVSLIQSPRSISRRSCFGTIVSGSPAAASDSRQRRRAARSDCRASSARRAATSASCWAAARFASSSAIASRAANWFSAACSRLTIGPPPRGNWASSASRPFSVCSICNFSVASCFRHASSCLSFECSISVLLPTDMPMPTNPAAIIHQPISPTIGLTRKSPASTNTTPSTNTAPSPTSPFTDSSCRSLQSRLRSSNSARCRAN